MSDSVRVIHDDMLAALPTVDAESIDAVVTDPPYHLTSIVKRFGGTNAAPAQHGTDGAVARATRGFMGKQWDGGDIAFRPETWAEVFRVLKPGAHLVAFSGTRTYHRMVCAIEDAGFEIRDQLAWVYASGFNKVGMLKNRHHELWCKCDGEQTPERDLRSLRSADVPASEYTGKKCWQVLFTNMPEQSTCTQQYGTARPEPEASNGEQPGLEGRPVLGAGQGLRDDTQSPTSASTPERLRVRAHPGGGEDVGASAPAGRGGSSQEPGSSGQPAGESEGLRLASGALDGGALRDGGCCPRCGGISRAFDGFGGSLKPAWEPIVLARKPLSERTIAANVLAHGTGAINVDACRIDGIKPQVTQGINSNPTSFAVAKKTRISGHPNEGRWPANLAHDGSPEVLAEFAKYGESKRVAGGSRGSSQIWGGANGEQSRNGHNDTGTAARFFYSAKADAGDRLSSKHPTVKPVDLMRWLVRMVTPPGGTVLDPFAGSGTTGMACLAEGFRAVLIEREAEYVADIRRRLAHVKGDDSPLFKVGMPCQ